MNLIPRKSTVCLALLLASNITIADDDDDKPTASAAKSLELSQPVQQHSGLQTQPLAAFSLGVETQAYGRVVDISPLLDLRARYRSAQSELAITDAALTVARKNRDRLAKLHAESIIPARELIQAESQLAADQARYEAAARHAREVREEALQSFGEAVFKQAAEAESKLFDGLLKHTLVLALIALPANQHLPSNVHSIRLAPSGERSRARQARLLSAAPKIEESTQGETWFFVAEAEGLRTGMRLDAWIPEQGGATQGVLLPLSAVVWRDGLAWVFVKTEAGRFVRKPVGAHSEQGEAWFVAQGFRPGERVVVVGGQMLLSEEHRRSGAATDGDDD
jgi:hypothetical protein